MEDGNVVAQRGLAPLPQNQEGVATVHRATMPRKRVTTVVVKRVARSTYQQLNLTIMDADQPSKDDGDVVCVMGADMHPATWGSGDHHHNPLTSHIGLSDCRSPAANTGSDRRMLSTLHDSQI
jgi:hypothetical protein